MDAQKELAVMKGHFAMCLSILKNISDQADINLDGTKLTISAGEHEAYVSIGDMVRKWESMVNS